MLISTVVASQHQASRNQTPEPSTGESVDVAMNPLHSRVDTGEDLSTLVRSDEEADHQDEDVLVPLTTKELVNGVFEGFEVEVERKWLVGSYVVANLTTLFIALSVIVFCISTLPHYQSNSAKDLDVIEAICIAYFVIEFIIRWASAPSQKGFWTNFLTWIDVLTIIPYFVYLGIQDSIDSDSGGAIVSVRVLRLIRVVRVLKLFKQNAGFDAVFEAFSSSKDALWLMLFMLIISVVTFSSCVYFSELQGTSFDEGRGKWVRSDGTLNPFQSIFHTMWWCVVTMTTVGYGDEVPVTGLGKFFASVTALCGVFVISFPTAILGANFAEIHGRKKAERRRNETFGRSNASRRQSLAAGTLTKSGSSPNFAISKSPQIAATSPPPAPVNAGKVMTVVPPGAPGALVVGNSAGGFGAAAETTETKLHYRLSSRSPFRDFDINTTVDQNGGLVAHSIRYGPVLALQTVSGDVDDPMLLIKAEEASPIGGRYFVLKLLLDSPGVGEACANAARDNSIAVDEGVVPVPKPIEKLRVTMTPPEPLDDIVLQCVEFHRPVGFVHLYFLLSNREVEKTFLRSMGQINFSFGITYEQEAILSLPMSSYTSSRLRKVSMNRLETSGDGAARRSESTPVTASPNSDEIAIRPSN